jgi:phosphoribosylanthranilate isomerase
VDGLQLDMIWPEIDTVKEYRKKYPFIKIILQGNTKAFELVGNDIDVFVQRVKEYKYYVDYILLDKSMGRGLGMDAQGLIPIVKSIQENIPHIGIAAAGGLGPNTLNLVESLAKEFPKLSIDAQGKLRPSGNALDPIDWDMAGDYLAKALKILK